MLSLKNFQKFLKDTETPSIVTLETSEGYIFDTVLRRMRRSVFGESSSQAGGLGQEETLNIQELGKQTADQVIERLSSISLFEPKKLLVLRNAEALDSQNQQILLEYLKASLSEHCYLIIQCTKLRANSKFKKSLESLGIYLKVSLEKRPVFQAWIRELAAEKKLRLSEDVVRFLIEHLPMNISLLERELEKLALFKAGDGRVNLEEASKLVCGMNMQNVFQFTDAIAEGNKAEALSTLHGMLDRGESPQLLMAMIGRHVRHLYRLKTLANQRVGKQVMSQVLETTSSFVIEKAARQARKFRLEDLRAAVRALHRADIDMKSTPLDNHVILEQVVWKLCNMPVEQKGGKAWPGQNRKTVGV